MKTDNLLKDLDVYQELVNVRIQLLQDTIKILEEENKRLKDRNEILSKRHPTTEEALAQYHWLKENSKRNK